MKKLWKIKNIAQPPQQIKITIALSSTGAPGIILQPGQFCLSQKDTLTAPMDMQKRRKYIEISDFDNSEFNLPLGKAFDESELDIATNSTEQYIK